MFSSCILFAFYPYNKGVFDFKYEIISHSMWWCYKLVLSRLILINKYFYSDFVIVIASVYEIITV